MYGVPGTHGQAAAKLVAAVNRLQHSPFNKIWLVPEIGVKLSTTKRRLELATHCYAQRIAKEHGRIWVHAVPNVELVNKHKYSKLPS